MSSRFLLIDLEKTYSSVVTCEPYMSFRSLLKAGQSRSIWCAVSSGSSTSYSWFSGIQYVHIAV